MYQAMEAAGSSMTLSEAARIFGVPKSTLSLKSRCFTPIDCRKGPSTILSSEEENYLVRSKKKNPFKNNRPGKHWYNAFMKRHPSLTKRISQNLTTTRAAVTETDLRGWFSTVLDYLEKKNLLSIDAKQVFNLDESAFMMVPKDNTVITKKGAKSVYQIVSASDKACITTLITASASGEMAPPMISFDSKKAPKKNILDNIPNGWGVGHTESGWMTAESFYYYIKNVFFKWLKENNHPFPVALYVDGHSLHCTLPLVELCQKNQIELIALYPNATHIIQPLDVALFRPLKASYAKEYRRYEIENDVVDFKKWMFASVLEKALEAVDFSKTIQSGFRATGLYPFNPDAVNYDVLNKNTKNKNCSEACTSNNSEDNIEIDSNVQRQVEFLQILENQIIPRKCSLDTQENDNVAIDSEHTLAVENTIDGELLQNSSLKYDILTNPTLSMEIVQESKQNIVFFPNEALSDLIQSDSSEESSSVNVMELIVDTNLSIHENKSNLRSNSPSVCINTPEITVEASANSKLKHKEIENIFEGCESDLSCHSNNLDEPKNLWTDNSSKTTLASRIKTSTIKKRKEKCLMKILQLLAL
ncbi:uncharacterized protein LOC130676348 [Microplitis mediator]|uniref:uncharacterized protein LOC130676348 n=1 Tax=Microplitis mediator TaxID=375433 RepID=UPI002554E78C|nr:uncharacterized protein LOC130676348 [Microplitis mediator]